MVLIMILDPSSCRKVLDEIVRSSLVEFPFRTSSLSTFFFQTSSFFQMKNRGALESFELEGTTSSTHLQPKKTWKTTRENVVPFCAHHLAVGPKTSPLNHGIWDLFCLRGFLFWSIQTKKRWGGEWIQQNIQVKNNKEITRNSSHRNWNLFFSLLSTWIPGEHGAPFPLLWCRRLKGLREMFRWGFLVMFDPMYFWRFRYVLNREELKL